MKGSTSTRIVEAVNAHLEQSPAAAASQILDLLMTENADLVIEWARERLAVLIHARMRPVRQPSPYQPFLPGFRGLEDRIPLKSGYTRLGLATTKILRESLSVIRNRKKSKVDPLERRLVDLIGKMDALGRRRLSVERYCELSAAAEIAPVKPEVSAARGRAAKKRWEKQTGK